jgi:hypothetical protein
MRQSLILHILREADVMLCAFAVPANTCKAVKADKKEEYTGENKPYAKKKSARARTCL